MMKADLAQATLILREFTLFSETDITKKNFKYL